MTLSVALATRISGLASKLSLCSRWSRGRSNKIPGPSAQRRAEHSKQEGSVQSPSQVLLLASLHHRLLLAASQAPYVFSVLTQACLWGLGYCQHMACCLLLQATSHPVGAGPGVRGSVPGLGSSMANRHRLPSVQPTQPNVHQGVAALSQSNIMLRTVQGAPLTDRVVRESTWYFTVLRPPSRSTLNCSCF